ncbi:MAG TPA: hypothetical protein VFH11_03555 [Gemmatimonadota bacterium]|nr:hypothetical protein [Gemmatimonadota bacterium]
MKPLALALFLLSLSVPDPIFAQPTAPEPADAIAPSDAQEAFEKLKTLAGSWVGPLTTSPAAEEVEGSFAQFSLRVTSRGNALVHEISVSPLPDHPLTMFYLEEDRLVLTHYCDAGNRPRMVGKLSPDGKTLEFDFLDLTGSNQYGHMHHAVFTFIDDNHHTEEWTWMMPDDKPVRVRFDLQRTNFESSAVGQ